MDSHDLPHARAVLGVGPGATLDELRTRYRDLAKLWHPDRHVGDPKGQMEAALQMRIINAAYSRVLKAIGPVVRDAAHSRSSGRPSRRLSKEEVERISGAIGTDSWVESAMFNGYWRWRPMPEPQGWLRRSGNAWKARAFDLVPVAFYAILFMFGLLGLLDSLGRAPDWLVSLFVLPLLAFLPVGLFLGTRVGCRVCGLHLPSSSVARELGMDQKWVWIASLEACPVCSDDGSATEDSRMRWRASGLKPESPYWTAMRVLGVLGAGLLIGALLSLTAWCAGRRLDNEVRSGQSMRSSTE